MSDLGKIIPLTTEEKELYLKLDFKYFLEQHIQSEKLSSEKIKEIHQGYHNTLEKIKLAKRRNTSQYHLFIEGYVRKMHSGGMLPTHFNLSEARSFDVLRYENYGEDWAYFDAWVKREKYLRFRRNIWKRVVEIGSIIGFFLGAIELYRVFVPK